METHQEHTNFDASDKVNRILEVIMAYAGLDFTQKTEVDGTNDVLDAIGVGVNMLGEELEVSTVSLREKEQLLKEVHHRVKNNLQIVSSLLSLQSKNISDEKLLETINDSRNRISSMALVHEMLYASKDLSKIEIGVYIQQLCENIYLSFAMPGSDIKFNYSIPGGTFFNVDVMIPIGLMINEIVSNSIKYAFPSKSGLISITLISDGNQKYQLIVSDNGIGLPEEFNPDKHANLGIQLIWMLVQQIDGHVQIMNDAGTKFVLEF